MGYNIQYSPYSKTLDSEDRFHIEHDCVYVVVLLHLVPIDPFMSNNPFMTNNNYNILLYNVVCNFVWYFTLASKSVNQTPLYYEFRGQGETVKRCLLRKNCRIRKDLKSISRQPTFDVKHKTFLKILKKWLINIIQLVCLLKNESAKVEKLDFEMECSFLLVRWLHDMVTVPMHFSFYHMCSLEKVFVWSEQLNLFASSYTKIVIVPNNLYHL